MTAFLLIAFGVLTVVYELRVATLRRIIAAKNRLIASKERLTESQRRLIDAQAENFRLRDEIDRGER